MTVRSWVVEEETTLVSGDGHRLRMRSSHRVDKAKERGGVANLPAVLLCHGFLQNRFAFECPSRSFPAFLRDRGFAVHLVELRGRGGDAAPESALAEYIEHDAPVFIRHVGERHEHVTWVGHSMGGLIGPLVDGDARARLSALVSIASPLVPRGGLRPLPRLSRLAIKASRVALSKGLRFPGRVYADALFRLRAAFNSQRFALPFNIWMPGALDDKDLGYALKESFGDDTFGVLADFVELALTQGHRAGPLDVDARLASLRTPLLVIGADADGLAPIAGALPLYERAGSPVKEWLELSKRTTGAAFGHLDVLIGPRAPALVWPRIARFLHDAAPRQSLARTAARA
jgi:pimeloyl-ACP methyl ester carboxylesterase